MLEGLWLWTKRPVFLDVYRFWLRIFAVGFAMGVVSGLVMSYQFGTNWSVFAKLAGPVVGPVMAYEVLTAFFLEAGFLGVMLFGMQKVGPRLHFAASCMVAFGTLLSGFWILSVNSWMQTPAGFTVAADGRFLPTSWMEIIFNPSVFVRFPHMILASYLSVAFVVGAVGAWHLLRNSTNAQARVMFGMAMWMAAIVAPLQIGMGDLHGLNTLEHQPAKIAAMEGSWEPRDGAPLTLFGLPDMKEERTKWAIEIPHLSSLILTHSWNGRVPGLLEFKPEDRPNAAVVFWSFRLMVGIGFAMLGIGAWSLWARYRGRLYESTWLQRAAVLMGPAGFVAILSGWVTTEVGRQPYTVYGLLRTVNSVAPIALPGVATSLAVFAVVYFAVFGSGVLILLRMMGKTPEHDEPEHQPQVPIRTAGIAPGPATAHGRAQPQPAE